MRRTVKAKVAKVKKVASTAHKCPICGSKVPMSMVKHNAGYCSECAFEAWGEGDADGGEL